MSEWISSLHAVKRLRAAGVAEPVSTLTHLAEARQIRARASWGRFDDGDEGLAFPQEPKACKKSGEMIAPWPDIPADFWRWINVGASGTAVQAEAGVFAATVIYNPEAGDYSDKEHIKLFGVTFCADDLAAVLKGVSAFHETPALPQPTGSRAGRKPELDRWAEFGAALAFVAYTTGPDGLRSEDALYTAAADALTSASREPLSKRTVRMMVKNALLWLDGDEIPPPPPMA